MRREPGQPIPFRDHPGLQGQPVRIPGHPRSPCLTDGLMETDDPSLADIVRHQQLCRDRTRGARSGQAGPEPCLGPVPQAVDHGGGLRRGGRPGAHPGSWTPSTKSCRSAERQGPGTCRTEPDANSLFRHCSISEYNRARGVIKVQDGCSHGCTYCIIPSTTRGRSVSRPEPADDHRRSSRACLTAGIREISLCGINLRHYGRDLSPQKH